MRRILAQIQHSDKRRLIVWKGKRHRQQLCLHRHLLPVIIVKSPLTSFTCWGFCLLVFFIFCQLFSFTCKFTCISWWSIALRKLTCIGDESPEQILALLGVTITYWWEINKQAASRKVNGRVEVDEVILFLRCLDSIFIAACFQTSSFIGLARLQIAYSRM